MERRAFRNRQQNGFTLIELMVVIAIIGILSAISAPMLSKYREHAKIAAAEGFGVQILNAFAASAALSPNNVLPDVATCDDLARVVTDNGYYVSPAVQAQYCPSGSTLDSPGFGAPGRLCMCRNNFTGGFVYYDCFGIVPPQCTPAIIDPPDFVITLPILAVQADLYVSASTITGVQVLTGDQLPFDGQELTLAAGGS